MLLLEGSCIASKMIEIYGIKTLTFNTLCFNEETCFLLSKLLGFKLTFYKLRKLTREPQKTCVTLLCTKNNHWQATNVENVKIPTRGTFAQGVLIVNFPFLYCCGLYSKGHSKIFQNIVQLSIHRAPADKFITLNLRL